MQDLSEAQGIAWPDPLPSLLDLGPETAQKHPDVVALVCTHQPPELYGIPNAAIDDPQYRTKPYLRWTYRDFREGVARLIDGLQAYGVQQGAPIFTFVSNSAEFVLLLWASFHMRCTLVPINPRNLQNTKEVLHMIRTAWSTCSSKQGFFIADNDDIADQISSLNLQNHHQIFVREPDLASSPKYLRFTDLMGQKGKDNHTLPLKDATGKTGIMLFTSGTTSLPKGVFNRVDVFDRLVILRQRATEMIPGDVLCLPVPNNHAMNLNFQITALCVGATVVFAGPAFTAGHILETMHLENVTHSILVPTMVHAMAAESDQYGGKVSSLKSVLVSGGAVTPEVLTACQDILGADALEGTFGMTEGVFIFGGSVQDRSRMIREYGVAVGKVNTGSILRICSPEDKPVLRGIAGELHYCGECLFDGYVGQETLDFYKDNESRKWFRTGDQAIMDKDGYIFIVGRFKENIIRGGENVSPAAIEAVLAREPNLVSLDVQIVGAPDDIAGEVPVALVQHELDEKTVQKIQSTVLKNMGPQYMPDQVLSIRDLGLDDLPKTMAGKIQKTKLKELVCAYRKQRDQDIVNGHEDNSQLKDAVRQVWKQSLGHDVDEDASIADFADSITLMRVRDRVSKATGKRISLSDMIEAKTVSGQIKLLSQSQQITENPGSQRKDVRKRHGVLTSQDILPFTAQPHYFEGAKTTINETLKKFGLSWNDVEAVSPAYDLVQLYAQDGTLDGWVITAAVLPTNQMTSQQLRRALEKTIINNPMLSSFLVWDQQSFGSNMALHVIPAPTEKVFDNCIVNGGQLASAEDLRRKGFSHVEKINAMFPGPLFHAIIFELQSTGTSAALIAGSHSVLDGSSAPLVFEDIDRALGGAQLDRHVDYTIWTDSYFALKTSFEAQNAVSWHVKRLQNIAEHRDHIYPKRDYRELTCTGLPSKFECSFSTPDVIHLRQTHRDITAPVILKTAFTLVNVFRTGHSHALYGNFEAARTRFPFVPQALESLEGHHFEASDVSGATIQEVLNLIEVRPDDTVLSFLRQMQEDQNNLTKYASAPMSEILSRLGNQGSRTMLDVMQWFIFNWAPGMGATGSKPYSNMELVNPGGRVSKMGILFNAGLGGDDSSTFFLKLKSSVLPVEDLKKFVRDIELVTKWLIDARNWNKTVSLYKEAL